MLTVLDLTSMTVVNPAPIIITDGDHNRMALGANGQLFIGAHQTATEIIPPIPPPAGCRSARLPFDLLLPKLEHRDSTCEWRTSRALNRF